MMYIVDDDLGVKIQIFYTFQIFARDFTVDVTIQIDWKTRFHIYAN